MCLGWCAKESSVDIAVDMGVENWGTFCIVSYNTEEGVVDCGDGEDGVEDGDEELVVYIPDLTWGEIEWDEMR